MLLIVATEVKTNPESEMDESTSAPINRQNLKESQLWIRKMKRYFGLLDLDSDGAIWGKDFDGMAKRFSDQENFDHRQRKTVRELGRDLFFAYTKAAGKEAASKEASSKDGDDDDDIMMTADLLIESVSMQSDDPAFKKTLQDTLLSLMIPMKVGQAGYFNNDEIRRFYESLGFVDTGFVHDGFVVIDADHDGKVSFQEYLGAADKYMCSDDEKTAAMFGHLA